MQAILKSAIALHEAQSARDTAWMAALRTPCGHLSLVASRSVNVPYMKPMAGPMGLEHEA